MADLELLGKMIDNLKVGVWSIDKQLRDKLPSAQAEIYLNELNAFKMEIAVLDNELKAATTEDEVTAIASMVATLNAALNEFESKIIPFLEGTSTGIGDAARVKSNEETINNTPRYSLTGQRVGQGYKGIVVENGKKVKR